LKRLAYLILGVLATGLVIAVVVTQHASWWQLVVFAIAPDLALLYGAGPGLERGRLHPRAVPFYNAVHRLWVPAILVAFMVVLQSPGWLAGGLAWIAHIAFDRSLGFGLRSPEGFQRA
jgi:hypothetical protein